MPIELFWKNERTISIENLCSCLWRKSKYYKSQGSDSLYIKFRNKFAAKEVCKITTFIINYYFCYYKHIYNISCFSNENKCFLRTSWIVMLWWNHISLFLTMLHSFFNCLKFLFLHLLDYYKSRDAVIFIVLGTACYIMIVELLSLSFST